MKQVIVLLNLLVLALNVFAQAKKDSCCMTTKDLVGIWQRDSKRVGNGLQQNFRFFDDGTFVVNFSNESEDARGIYAIKGKYRLVGNKLYLTIISKTVVEGGKIVPTGSNETFFIFTIEGGEVKEIKEVNPKELPDPIYIIIDGKDHIEISNETYYKISKEDLKAIGIDPKAHE
jgi:uncharacterized protein (TIGR03066 family)